jgi:hypothetical protein
MTEPGFKNDKRYIKPLPSHYLAWASEEISLKFNILSLYSIYFTLIDKYG